MPPIAFSLKEVAMLGTGFFAIGGLFARSLIQGKNITALWDKKQDVTVCNAEHIHVSLSLERIEDNVDWLVKRAKNGGE